VWYALAPGGRGGGYRWGPAEAVMKEDTFNIEVRKFLKEVGVTSQREIERAVRRALEAGRLEGDEKLKVSARIQIERIELDHRVEGEIALS
jgi:hypothetical protein